MFGYVANFARSKLGFMLFILVPAVAIIGNEVRKIFQEVQKTKSKKKI